MSLDINTLVKAVKSAAVSAVAAQKPVSVCYGEVLNASPLTVLVDQKMVLTDVQLLLTSAVRDFTIYTTDADTPATEPTKHVVHLGLHSGEKVLLLRCDGGQRFIVLDRAEEVDT